MKKKVLILSDSLGCGGSEQSLVSMLSTLDYSKVDVDLWLRDRNGIFERYLPNNVNVITFNPIPNNRLGYWFAQKLYSLDLRVFGSKKHTAEMLWSRVEKYVSPLEKVYDVAISFQQGYPTFYLATKVNAKKKATRVNIDMEKANYNQDFCRKYYDMCDTVVAISDAIKNQLYSSDYVSDKSKVKVIYNVFSVSFIQRMAEEPGFCDDYKGLRIVTTGRLVEQKGYGLAVKAAEILKKQGLYFRWYFIGEGEKRVELESMIAERKLQDDVILLGMQPNPYPFMKNCDIYVQTSLFEGFGRTVTEAKINHCPIVSTNFPSIYDQMEDGKNGLIVEMDADKIAEKILLIAKNETLRNSLIKAVSEEKYTTSITESAKWMDYMLS
ncbi:MAG: glycosyltransferase [Sodaliphilus sp.]